MSYPLGKVSVNKAYVVFDDSVMGFRRSQCRFQVRAGQGESVPIYQRPVSIRGQFHKAKKFVITKIIFVITKISNFFLNNLQFVNCNLQIPNLSTHF